MTAALVAYVPLLLFGLAIECLVVGLATKGDGRRAALRACVAVNLLLHPTTTLLSWHWRVDSLSLQLLEFLAEWLVYRQLLDVPSMTALRLAFAANLIAGLANLALWIGMLT